MTKYKQLAEEAAEKLNEATNVIVSLKDQLYHAQTGLCEEMCTHIENEQAREILRSFADRAKNKEELVLLIRALSKL